MYAEALESAYFSRCPIVSVILPTYNRAKTLKRAIESVLNQTYRDFELIIVDDGSTDETLLILGEYFGLDNVRLISQLRHGCSVARNIGIYASRGRYIAFQDSDDEWLPGKLEKAMSLLNGSGPETGVFYSDMVRVQVDGSRTKFQSPDVERGMLINEHTLDYQVYGIGIQSAVIKRECFARVGNFDEALTRFIDLELFIRMSDHYQFIHYREPLVKYYAVEGISTNSQALVNARHYLLKKYRSRLAEQDHYLAKQYLYLSRALTENGNRYRPLVFVLKALLCAPRHAGIREEVFELLSKRDDLFSRLGTASNIRLQRTRNIARLLFNRLSARR
jgi:glycosyltransferase involved in cell wall biosynthesis